MKVKKNFKNLEDYLWIVLGAVITASGINIFLVPYKIAPGGVSGIATVLYYLSGERLPVGFIMLFFNIPLFILGIRFIGKKFVIKTLLGTILLSLTIDMSRPIGNYIVEKYLINPDINGSSPDILLYSMFGGLLMGIGLGLVFRSGATTGGTDLAARILNPFMTSLTLGQTLLLIDSCVIVFAAIVFQSFQLALYAIVALYISSKIIDAILEGVNFSKALFIISDMSEKIAPRILKELDRGVTALKGTGMYTKDDKQVLLCVVHRGQLTMLKRIVREIDEKAFIILTDIREVLGEGFKK
ncbi:UNVERIFIED_CONTAM: uncharacterized membrane-anchored protein YitT (DUF2179 family) [Acetivibrio alkalicellulosi]